MSESEGTGQLTCLHLIGSELMKSFTATLVVILAAIHPLCGEEPQPRTPNELIGFWVATEIQSQGEATPPVIEIDLEFTQTQMMMRFGDRHNKPVDVFNCFSVAKSHPLSLDLRSADQSLKPDKQIHIRAIYELDGNTLRICAASGNASEPSPDRPTNFVSTNKPETDFIVLKRRPK